MKGSNARNGNLVRDDYLEFLSTGWALQIVLPFFTTASFVALPPQVWVSLKQVRGEEEMWGEETAIVTETNMKTQKHYREKVAHC